MRGTQAHAALLKQMLLAARQTVALVDGSKLGRTGVARIGGLGELDCLVTERFVDPLLEKEMTGITSACKSPEYAVMT